MSDKKMLLANVALWTVIITLASTLIAIWFQLEQKEGLLRLTQLLLSWQVIAGGLAVAGGKTFTAEIKGLLQRVAK